MMAMVGNMRTIWRRFVTAAAALAILLCSLLPAVPVRAAQLSNRGLTIGDITPGAVTSHNFKFTFVSPDPVGSVRFEYCTSPLPDLPCDTPPGLDASAATLTGQTGEADFSILTAQPNLIVLTRAAAAAPANNASSYSFDGIVNPGPATGTFYVRISTHASADASDAMIDSGAVVNATSQEVTVSTEVPPILKFCVGLELADDCTTADDSLIDLGDLAASRASSGSSQMLAATNAEFGLAIAAYGTTLTSGNNIIRALSGPTFSAPGNAQFGINLRDNSDPDVGQNPSGIGIASPTGDYNIPNRYLFRTGDVVATSPAATDVRKFTVSYIANVPPSQPPGVYTATLTYICSATF